LYKQFKNIASVITTIISSWSLFQHILVSLLFYFVCFLLAKCR